MKIGFLVTRLVSSADKLFKQFGPRSDLGPNWLTLMVFLKDNFHKKLILKIISRRQKSI